LRKKKVEIGIY